MSRELKGSMIRLNYTEEMEKQDELWKTENEDLDIMKKCYEEILNEARVHGFNGFFNIYTLDCECVCEIYNNEDEYKQGKETEFIFGYCKPLIDCLEKRFLNK